MAITAGTMTIPISATVNGKAVHLGDLVLDVRIVNGRMQPPKDRDIKSALRKARF